MRSLAENDSVIFRGWALATNRISINTIMKKLLLVGGILTLSFNGFSETNIEIGSENHSISQKSPDEFVVLNKSLKKQINEIFEIDYKLKFNDEKTNNVLKSRLLEKSKLWFLLSIKETPEVSAYIDIQGKWPFFINGIQYSMNRDLFSEYVRNNNRNAYELIFKEPVLRSLGKNNLSKEEKYEILRNLRDGNINDFSKDKMIGYYLVTCIFNKKLIENLSNQYNPMGSFYTLEYFVENAQNKLIEAIPAENSLIKNPAKIKEKNEFKISDIWGDPMSFVDLSKIEYNKKYLHQYHIDHKKKEENENDETYENRLKLWDKIYNESVNEAVKYFAQNVDSISKKIQHRNYTSFLNDKEFIFTLLPQHKEVIERIQNPKGYDIDKFSDAKRFQKELSDAQEAERRGQSWGHGDPDYIKSLLARELESGKTKAVEQRKKDLELLPLIQIRYMLVNISLDDTKSLLKLFRKDIPDYIEKLCFEKFDDQVKSKTKNKLSFILENSIIKESFETLSWKHVLQAESGPDHIYNSLIPEDIWKDRFIKPKSRVFKDIAFGMTLQELLNTNAVRSKAIRIQNNYDKGLENELEYSDLYASTELFGDETILRMNFGWGISEDDASVSLKKQLVSIEFIPTTVKQLKESDSQLMDGMFGDVGEIEGKARMAQNLQQYGFTDAAQYYQKQSNEKMAALLSNRQKSENLRKSHAITMIKWIKGLESAERPYRFVKGVDLTSGLEDLMGLHNKISYYTNNPAIKIENNEIHLSSDVDQNIPDINIAKVSNEGLCFYPARKIDQTPRLMFIWGLLASWHKHETERYEENLNINKNKGDF